MVSCPVSSLRYIHPPAHRPLLLEAIFWRIDEASRLPHEEREMETLEVVRAFLSQSNRSGFALPTNSNDPVFLNPLDSSARMWRGSTSSRNPPCNRRMHSGNCIGSYGPLEGLSGTLDVERPDIDGCLYTPVGGPDSRVLVFFDALLSGSGHAGNVS